MSVVSQQMRPLRFFRDGHNIQVPPEVLAALGGDPTVPKRVPAPDAEHGYNVIETRESLLTGDRLPNAGLIDWLSHRAVQRGVPLVESCDVPLAALPAPVPQQQSGFPAWPQFVHDFPRGLVRLASSVDKAQLIAVLALAFPGLPIMVLGVIRELNVIYTALRGRQSPLFGQRNQVALVHSGRRLQPDGDAALPRVILCTPMAAADLDCEHSEILIVLDAFASLHERMQWPLIAMDGRFRLFGLQAANRQPTRYERARLHQVFGFQQLDLTANGRVRREVNVAWIPQYGPAPVGTTRIGPTCRGQRGRQFVDSQAAYVTHPRRNDQICRLARQLRDGRPVTAERFQEVRRWQQWREPRPLSVTVLVDHLDHAIELSERLPDWRLIAAADSNLDGLPARIRRRIRNPQSSWDFSQIVVSDVARECPGFHSDVVIWAAGGVAVNIPPSWMFSDYPATRPLLVVDFEDNFAPATRNQSLLRQRHLADQDIFRVGTSAFVGRIERFERLLGAQS